jgi:DNA (cytosine-5)-methyltransferase 1
MSIGLQEAARRLGRRLEIPLAIEQEKRVMDVYKANLPSAVTELGDVTAILDGDIGGRTTSRERTLKKTVGEIDLLLGGPPCQGHSDLNNHTRRRDPKNALYQRMARAAEVLGPKVVIVENVVTVQRDESGVVEVTSQALARAGYEVAGRILDLRRLGVPQRRRRFLLIASNVPEIAPASVLDHLAGDKHRHGDRTVRWAIQDLIDVDAHTEYDRAGRLSAENVRRIEYLFAKDAYDLPNSKRPECHRDVDHSYASMYGRLRWDEPAQTITTGFGSMGQGRYVHPARPRTLTPHEAARLQTFPDWFDFGSSTFRTTMAEMIGNAVPPLLMVSLGNEILTGLPAKPKPKSA